MPKSTLKQVVYALVLLTTLGLVTAVGQERPPFELYQQKIVNFPGLAASSFMVEWQVTGKKTSFVYLIDSTENPLSIRLLKYKLSQKGTSGQPVVVLSSGNVLIIEASLVWFGQGGGAPRPAAGGGAGLLFIAYASDEKFTKMTVAVAGVDEEGLITGGFSKILEKNAPADQIIFAFSLEAVEGPDSVIAVVSFIYIDTKGSSGIYGPYKSASLLIKTDRSGLVTGGISEVPLPGNGYLNLCLVGAPYWTGSGWMTAACNTKIKLIPTPDPDISYATLSGNELYVYTIADGNTTPAAKFSRRLLYKDAQSDDPWTFKNFKFFPVLASDGPKAKAGASKLQNLFFAHRIAIPYDDQKMDRYTEDYYVIPINKRGKRAGNSVKVQMPQWVHGMPYDSEKLIYGYANTISNLVQDDSGRLLAAGTRSTLLGTSASGVVEYDCEHELSLYRIDPATGAVEILARKTGADPVGVYSGALIRWFNNRIAVINGADVYQPNYGVKYYYAVVSP